MDELKDVVDWFELGVHLKLDVAKLKGIEEQNGSDTKECKREMLQVWMDTVGESDWPSIVTALKKLNKKHGESFVQVSGAYYNISKGYHPLTC
jgi:hypothetical protein